MSAPLREFEHPLLTVATPPEWVAAACENRDTLLIDHANCEKKAASTALALMFAYAEDLDLTDKMSRLAREELRHYEQVAKLIQQVRVVPQRLAPGRYADRLRRLVSREEPQREVDLMVCGAFIEADPVNASRPWASAIGSPLARVFRRLAQGRGAPFQGVPGACQARGARKAQTDLDAPDRGICSTSRRNSS